MAEYPIFSFSVWFLLLYPLILSMGQFNCSFADSGQGNSFILSSFSYPETKLKQYEWRYIRVDLPWGFSSVSIMIESDVELDPQSVFKISNGSLPLICFRGGSLPLPDSSDDAVKKLVVGSLSNWSAGEFKDLQNAELCYLMQKSISLKWSNEQIMPGVWYFGLFNGIGATRTQSKMIIRGSSYSFSANVTVEGCSSSNVWGQYCNQSVESLTCSQPLTNTYSEPHLLALMGNQTVEQGVYSRTVRQNSCYGYNEPSVYSLEIPDLAEQLTITATDVGFNGTSSMNNTNNAGGINIMCYVRYGSIPLTTVHDYSADISKGPLMIPLPQVGRWYIRILPVNATMDSDQTQASSRKACYSLMWQLLECPVGKAGLNCTWQRHALQTVLRKNPSAPFESYYIPLSGNMSSGSAIFALEPLLSNLSASSKSDGPWTYFVLDVPRGAAGGNMHIKLVSDTPVRYEIYARFDGLPSVGIRDYFYVNKMNNSNDSPFFTSYSSSDDKVEFYILFIREGTWSFGIKHVDPIANASHDQTMMSISLERCPKRCSAPHGSCQNFVDESGLTIYSYCSCDRTHGGIDCSIELVSHRGHLWQSISLIASNVAAVFPAYWALRQKALAEWVIFTSSGISSALYHACDVGTWCALKFGVLQFMDFWLSFMAVVSTFVYLAEINEASKRTIHAAVSILTALMAITGATRSSNIVLVIIIGATGLLIGWLIEFSTRYRSFSLPTGGFCMNVLQRRQNIRNFIVNAARMFLKRFRLGFVVAGLIALTMAAISWKLETSESYWIWHSIWHVSIYTSSFLFLCSKVVKAANPGNQTSEEDGDYRLTRQNSLPRGEE
ncbi:hypothetical protein Dimus_006565 [Dionaea muscipula]